MREFQRTTRSCTPAELRPELLRAVEDHVWKFELGNAVADTRLCVETATESLKKEVLDRFLGGGPAVQYTGALLTPDHLLWATTDGREVVAAHARLTDIDVSDFQSPLTEDSGLTVFGFVNGSPERVQAFIGLGDGDAADSFRQAVKDAVS